MTLIWDWANPQLRDLPVYEPGKPIEETARELGVKPKEIVKLASNENPIGPSPKAVAAMQKAAGSISLYPDAGGFFLGSALAAKLGCARENIILGNGSNEIIELIGHAFLRPGEEIITFEHAFIAYKLVAGLFGARTIEVPVSDFQPDPIDLLKRITPKTKIVFVANPNNPTGVLISNDKIDNLLESVPENIAIVLDEAYFEFLDHPTDTIRHIQRHRNLILLRTFSKIYGLASLRVGYGVAHREMIEVLQKARQPFNVNVIGQVAALAALEDSDHLVETKRVVDTGRAFLENEFATMKSKFVPSAGNFVFVEVGDGQAIFEKLLACKIIVRRLAGYNLPEWLRITVGTMEQNQKCIAALKEMLS